MNRETNAMKNGLSAFIALVLLFTSPAQATELYEEHNTQSLKHTLFLASGIRAVRGSDILDSKVLTALIDIFQRGLPSSFPKNLKRLKYLYAFKSRRSTNRVGFYDDRHDAIAVLGKRSGSMPTNRISTRALYDTLAHEIGHAVVFSILSPEELADAAATFGGWPRLDENKPGLHDPFFLSRPYSKQSYDATVFPSSYAFTNVHEWFAENFARHILARLSLAPKGKNPAFSQYLERLLHRTP
jgi:hypothetical protein